jgi:diguanylate cyclase (GGDEF)-like protein/PAS domain S-box-containing protein
MSPVLHPLPTPRATTDLLQSLVAHAPLLLAYYDAAQRRCLYASTAYAAVWGLRPQDLLGQTPAELDQDHALARHLPLHLEQALLGGSSTSFETPLPVPNPCTLPRIAEVTLTPDRLPGQDEIQGICVVMNDITHHREIERAMTESEGRLARFMQASVEGILFHRDGRVIDANPACCELIGRSLHGLLGQPLLELIAPEQRHRLQQLHGSSADLICETMVVHRDGSRIPVELIDRPTLEQGQPLRMVVLRDVRDRHAAQAHMQYLAHHDALTGLPNRQGFMIQLEHLMYAARQAQTELALLFIDLDHFKRLNDSIGHTAGDAQLRIVAQRISDCVRTTDRVARFGGDEFMVLLPGIRDVRDVARVAAKLQGAIATPMEIEQRPISVTPSIGIALFPRDGDTPELLIKHADTAMHMAKARGRAGHAFFDHQVAASAYAQLVLEGQLGQAIAQGEFALMFQPQVRSSDDTLLGVEALIRWQHPERGLLAPDEFIPLAEQHRLMVPIGAWVLHEAARCAQHWHALGQPVSVAVNLSTMQFQAPGFVESVRDLLARTGLGNEWLELELTERMLMDDVPQVCQRLQQLRALGVRISVDDFGTGYSSMSHLKDLPIDKLKIDRSFVKDLPTDRHSGAITAALIQLAHGLGLSVVAEGVETEAQRRFLARHGCDQLQGMGISPPLSAAQFERWLEQRRHAAG